MSTSSTNAKASTKAKPEVNEDPTSGAFGLRKDAPAPLQDLGQELMTLFATELKRRLVDNAAEMTSAELEVVRKLLGDNSITLASIRRGDFGTFAKSVAEQFPFPQDEAHPAAVN